MNYCKLVHNVLLTKNFVYWTLKFLSKTCQNVCSSKVIPCLLIANFIYGVVVQNATVVQ